jgi:FixJ family two-component response regulator
MGPAAGESAPLVVVVDGDPALCGALKFTLEIEGYRVVTCDAVADLLALDLSAARACLVIEERLHDLSGLAALAELRRRGMRHPAILTATAPKPEILSAAAAMGVRIVEKPLMGDTLICAIRAALNDS